MIDTETVYVKVQPELRDVRDIIARIRIVKIEFRKIADVLKAHVIIWPALEDEPVTVLGARIPLSV